MYDGDVTGAEDGSGVDTERAFELLAHSRRRELMRCLVETPDRTWHVASLASDVVSRGRTWAGSPEVRDIVVSLHHVHLPKLDDAGLIAYDPRSRTVSNVDREAIAAVFEAADRETVDRGLV
jgi:hypothetical protein